MPQYEDLSAGLSFTNVTAANSPPQSQDDCDSLLPYFPNTPFIFDSSCIDVGTGCCCNQYGGVALTGIDDTPSVYKYYCEQANPNYVFSGQTQVQNSGYTTCQSYCTSGSPSSYNLTGYVSYQGNGSLLPGATINVLDSELTAITNNAGQYQLNGVLNGWNSFEVSVAPIYVLNGDNLTCNVTSEYLFIGEDREINFTLDCIPNQEICEPYWVTGEWGPCVPYGNTAVQFREVSDLNDCNTSVNRPASVNISACEGVILNDCGNGLIDGTERCDINKTSEDEIYVLPSGGTSESRPKCKDFFPDVYDSGDISCTDTCNYDYSDCEGCGPICSQPSQCGVCPQCIGDPLCGNPCDTVKPNFLDAFTDREGTRNVHDLYQEIKSDPQKYSGYDYGVHYFEGTNDVMIEWNYNDSCKNTIMGYKLSICEEDPDNPNFCKSGGENHEFVIEGVDMGQEHFKMSNVLQKNTSYCYNVCAVGINKATLCAANESEKLVCFKTGDEYCMTPHEPGLNCEFVTVGEGEEHYVPHGCVYSDYAYTNLSDGIQECNSGTTCVETNYNPSNGLYGASCHATAECDYCNGIFGLYGGYDLNTLIDGNSQKCSNLLYEQGNSPPGENSVVGLCYKDASLSPEPVYKACGEVHSCYDYTSKDACENDYCYAFTNSSLYNDCQWKYLDEETGIGVCSPKTDELQNCRACDTNSPLGFCDEDICSLYGDCYYKDELNHGVYEMPYRPFYDTDIQASSLEENYLEYLKPYTTPKTHPTCLNKNEMSCYMYENEEDCTGGINLSIDIVHNPNLFNTSNFNNTILYGTNKILNSSNDTYHFGDCEWNPEQTTIYKNTFGCQKNSDGVYNFKSAPNKNSNKQDDCVDFGLENNVDYSKCFQDNTPPETTLILRPGEEQEQYKGESGDYLPVYGRYEIANMDYSTTDNIWDSTDIDTRVSFISLENCSSAHCLPSVDCPSCDEKNINGMQACYALGCELYPQHSFSEFLDEALSKRLITNGEHIMAYYSKDPAQNLEEVHYKRIYIDTSKPEIINFTKNISSFKLAEDIYATNLSINFSTTEPALCHGTLYLQRPDGSNRTHPSGDFIIANKTSFGTSYRELPDGDYEFYINCSDTYQNEVQQVESFRIEGDASIANPWPRGQVFRDVEDVILSLETQNNASCKLSFMDNLSYAQSPTTFEETGGLNHTHHFYPLEVSGNTSGVYIYYTSCLFDNGSVTEQQASDVISFTMDRLAPTTKLTVYDSDVDDYVEYNPSSASYTDEKDFKLICNDTNDLIPIRTFNCANISYCFGPGIENLDDFTIENNCMDGELLSAEGNELDLTAQFIQDAGYFIYYFSSDKGSNVENIHMANMKIRDTSFVVPPYFEIITN